MATFKKHRDERELLAYDYAAELSASETLTGTPTVTMSTRDLVPIDKTTEFRGGESAAAINGTKIEFWVKPAAANAQLKGLYRCYCKVNTSNNRVLVAQDSRQRVMLLRVYD